MSSGVGLIARREFVERGRSRVFIGVLIGSMVLILGGMFALSLLGRAVPAPSVTLAGASSAGLAEEVQKVAGELGVDIVVVSSGSVDQARQAVASGAVDAALVNGDTILAVGVPLSSVNSTVQKLHV